VSDTDLVSSVNLNGCSGCFCKLIELHSNLFYKICNKYVFALGVCGISRDDVLDNRNFVFFDTIKTFDPSRKIKFSTWLANKARFFCLNLLNSRKRMVNFSNEDIKKAIENKSFSTFDNDKTKEEISYVMFLLDNLKDKRIKQIFQLRYLEGSRKVKWKKIAMKMNISVQTAINLHSRGVQALSKKLKSKEIYDLV